MRDAEFISFEPETHLTRREFVMKRALDGLPKNAVA
jgi:hypothetical protein